MAKEKHVFPEDVAPGDNPLFPEWETVPAHEREEDLDPKVHGPFLDDVRADQERAYRERRNKGTSKKKIEAGSPGLTDEEIEVHKNSVLRDDREFEHSVAKELVSHPSATQNLDTLRPSDGDAFDDQRREYPDPPKDRDKNDTVARINKVNARKRVGAKKAKKK